MINARFWPDCAHAAIGVPTTACDYTSLRSDSHSRVSRQTRRKLRLRIGWEQRQGNPPRCRYRRTVRGDGARLEGIVNSTYFGLLAEFGEANIPLDKVAPKYFGLSYQEARRRAPTKMLPCKAFRLGGQKSPWLVSAVDLAALIDQQRQKAG